MNTFKKKAALTFTILTGLNFSCIPMMKAEKVRVSEMSKTQRIKTLITGYSALFGIPLNLSLIGGGSTDLALKNLATFKYSFERERIASLAALSAALIGLGIGSIFISNQIDAIEYDENFSLTDHISGASIGLGLSLLAPFAFILLTKILN